MLYMVIKILIMSIFVGAVITDSEIEVKNKTITAFVNGNVSFLCKVPYKITYCMFRVPKEKETIFLSDNQIDTNYIYFGNGLEKGECGISIINVQEKHNGNYTCATFPAPGSSIQKLGEMMLIVARPPQQPKFKTSILKSYNISDQLDAECVVKGGRPAANISWYLDDTLLLDGVSDSRIIKENSRFTVSQNFSRKLTANDSGHILKCVATHIALKKKHRVKSAQINVIYKPIPRDGIIIDEIRINENALINITVQANPRPSFEWYINKNLVNDSSLNGIKKFQIDSTHLGGDLYNATLLIMNIEIQDIGKVIQLIAFNDIGNTTYNVILITPEKQTEKPILRKDNSSKKDDLYKATLLNVLCGVFIILIGICITCFAKIKKIWCFREKFRQQQDNDKRNSDMEDAYEEFMAIQNSDLKTDSKLKEKNIQYNTEPTEMIYAELVFKTNKKQNSAFQSDKTEYATIVFNPIKIK